MDVPAGPLIPSSITMAGQSNANKNLGGRPPLEWSSTRNRKLVRLYTMTKLNHGEISKLLRAKGFDPKPRTIQAQLKKLLPDDFSHATFSQYRPANHDKAKQRLAQFKRVKEYQRSKHRRAKARIQCLESESQPIEACRVLEKLPVDTSDDFSSVPIPGVPSHVSLPLLSTWYSDQPSIIPYSDGPTPALAEDERRSSDKEVFVPETMNCPSTASETTAEIFSAIQNTAGDTQVPSSPAPERTLPSKRVKRTYSELSNNGTVSTRRSSLRLSTRASSCLRHARSVLSFTNTETSSFIYSRSLASAQQSTDCLFELSRVESVSWEELVDESRLSAAATQYPVHREASLQLRTCCLLSPTSILRTEVCNTCGCSKAHQTARLSQPGNGELQDIHSVGRFGNTPLHYAAAAGNTANMLQLMLFSNIVRAPVRNAFGETFMHVLHLDGCERFPEFFEVVKRAEQLGFPFLTRDYYGRTVAHRLHELPGDWHVEFEELKEVYRILKIGQVLLDNLENKFGLQMPKAEEDKGKEKGSSTFARLRVKLLNELWPHSKRMKSPPTRSENCIDINGMDDNGDTVLLAALKNWPRNPKTLRHLEMVKALLQDGADIHIRDRQGYTPLAVASRLGLRRVVIILLERGAKVNTRSHQGTSLYGHLYMHMQRARKENQDILYAGIVSCMELLASRHAKEDFTVYDEYAMPTPDALVAATVDVDSIQHFSEPLCELEVYPWTKDDKAECITELDVTQPLHLQSWPEFFVAELGNAPFPSPLSGNGSIIWPYPPPATFLAERRLEINQLLSKGQVPLFETSGNNLVIPKRRGLDEQDHSSFGGLDVQYLRGDCRTQCPCGYRPSGNPKYTQSNLARHMRSSHSSAQKSYCCPIPGCGNTHTRSDNLRVHVRSGRSKHICGIDDCRETFLDNEDLKTHQRRNHIKWKVGNQHLSSWRSDDGLGMIPEGVAEVDMISSSTTPLATAQGATTYEQQIPSTDLAFKRTHPWSKPAELGFESLVPPLSDFESQSLEPTPRYSSMSSFDLELTSLNYSSTPSFDEGNPWSGMEWSTSFYGEVDVSFLGSKQHNQLFVDRDPGPGHPTAKRRKGNEVMQCFPSDDLFGLPALRQSTHSESTPGPLVPRHPDQISTHSSKGKETMRYFRTGSFQWEPGAQSTNGYPTEPRNGLEPIPSFPDTGDPHPLAAHSSKGKQVMRSSEDHIFLWDPGVQHGSPFCAEFGNGIECSPHLPDTGDPVQQIATSTEYELLRDPRDMNKPGPTDLSNHLELSSYFADTGDPAQQAAELVEGQQGMPQPRSESFLWDPRDGLNRMLGMEPGSDLESMPNLPGTVDPVDIVAGEEEKL